jgi:hypothetical protein
MQRWPATLCAKQTCGQPHWRCAAANTVRAPSRDRDSPFGFKLGSGVIPGWSDGVATMVIGEVAQYAIKVRTVAAATAQAPRRKIRAAAKPQP